MATTPGPSVDDVTRIAAIESPVLRNLAITDCYSRLAAAFAERVGEGANWCTYATWASKQAGASIRGEDMQGALGRALGERRWLLHPFATLWRRLLRRGLFQPATRLGRVTAALHTPFDAFERASDAVARGNLKVFAEIGLEFARCLGEPDGAAFLAGLRPGDPPDGQRYLRQAFARYEQARNEHDPGTRAQLTVLANLEVGFHEQTRLQPEIREALDAAEATGADLERRAVDTVFPGLRAIFRRPLGAVVRRLQRASSTIAREVVTENLMVLALPGRVLVLSANMLDEIPGALRDPADPDLRELLALYEPVSPAPDDCGARDWSDLDQRMHYIVHLFCVFHERPELFDQPFTPAQSEALARGELPQGEL